MGYGGAVHGPWCGARTYAMRCRYCGEKIFYFSCGCGSQVFFEELGPPWPRHYCGEYAATIMSPTPLPGIPDASILAEAIMRPKRAHPAFDVDPTYVRKMQAHVEKERLNHRGEVPMDPPPKQAHKDIGLVKDLAPQVNIFKQFKMPENDRMAAAFLGELAKEPMARIVLVVDDPEQEDLERYSCYIPQKLLRRSGVIREDIVNFVIKPLEVPGKGRFWLCVELEPPFEW